MGITVQNVTDSTALVIWPSIYGCSDSFYSLMYHPNWNSMLSAHSRKDFQKEERVPGRRTSFTIESLTPLTTYILCVTCQSRNPTSDQCQVFNTLPQDPASANSKKKELALGIWLTSSILILLIVCIVVYGCLHIWWRKRRQNSEEPNASSEQDKEMWMKSTEETSHSRDNRNHEDTSHSRDNRNHEDTSYSRDNRNQEDTSYSRDNRNQEDTSHSRDSRNHEDTSYSRDNRNQPVPNNVEYNVEPTQLDMTENTLTDVECGKLNSDNQEPVPTPEEAVSDL